MTFIHFYEVQKIEVLDNDLPSTSNGVGTQKKDLSAYPLAKLLKDVEKSYGASHPFERYSEKTRLEKFKVKSYTANSRRRFFSPAALPQYNNILQPASRIISYICRTDFTP